MSEYDLAADPFPLERDFVGPDGNVITLQHSTISQSMYHGHCPTCGGYNVRHVCYRCGEEINDPPSVTLKPPFGTLDSRAQDNWLCPRCLVSLQRWLNASDAVVAGTSRAYRLEE